MMGELGNLIRQHAEQAMASTNAQTRIGVVTNYYPGNGSNGPTVNCTLQPDGLPTGPIPVASQWVGNGWGLFSPPSIGDWVLIQALEGDLDAAVMIGRLWTAQAPALAVPSGEFWLVHQEGGFIKFTNDKKLTINVPSDWNVTVGGNTNITVQGNANLNVTGNINSQAAKWTHQGPVTVQGALTVTQAITGQGGMAISGGSGASVSGNLAVTSGNVTADGIDLKGHTHGGVQSGGSSTGGPQG